MARARLSYRVTDRAGNAVQNARVLVQEDGTSTPVTDLFAAESGGSPLDPPVLTSNAQGEIEGFLTTPRYVKVTISDNTNAAYYPAAPANQLSFDSFDERRAAEPAPTAVAEEAAARIAADTAETSARSDADALLIPLTQKGAANGVATLGADSKIPSAQIPAIALSEFLGNVASEAAMLALTGQKGDWAIRTDFDPDRVFILKTDDPTQAANWSDITGPGDVLSVNGQTGAVVLDAGDVGADPTGSAAAAESDANAYTDTRVTKAVIDALGIDAATLQGSTLAQIQTAITAGIVDSAPGTLDTLNELAAALGDDPNFVTTLTALIGTKQPLDADLTAIAALDSSTAGALVTDGAGWIRKTYAQLKTALGLVKGDVGLGNVDNTSDANKPVSTAQQTALDLKANLASAVMDGDAAGGVLSGTFPNPGFASDMATQAELDTHTANKSQPHAPTKVAGRAVSNTNTSTTTSISDWLERFPVRLPVTSTRWRLHVRNYDYRASGASATTGVISCVGAYVGTPVFTSGVLTGQFSATPTQALSSFATNTDGSEYVSGWVTDAAAQFTAGKNHLISLGFTCTGGQTLQRDGSGFSFFSSGAGTSATLASTSATPGGVNLSILDIWIEYEFVGEQPIVLVIGDSIPHGYLSSFGPRDSWVNQWSQRTRCPVVDNAFSGSTTAHYTTLADAKYSRFTGITPDAVIVHLTTNDVSAGTATATIQSNLGTIISNIRTTWGANIPIFLATICPRNFTGATEAARLTMNTWLRGLPYGVNGCFSMDKATEDYPTRAVVDGATTNASPTVTSATAVFTAADVGRAVIGTGIPAGSYVGVVNSATSIALSSSPASNVAVNATATATGVTLAIGGTSTLNPEWANADGIHVKTQGHARMADVVGKLMGVA